MLRPLAVAAAALLALSARAQTPAPAPAAADPAVTAAPVPAVAAPAPAPEPAKPAKSVLYVIAARSKLTVSGRAWAGFENVGATDGSAPGASEVPSRWRLRNGASFLSFRGETELRENWKAFAQVEAEFGLDGEEGTPFSGTRNTGVGIQSPYGTLIAGRWDSPTKKTTLHLDPWGGVGIFGYYNIMGQQQVSATGSGSNRWDRRLNNGLFYTSPTFSGFTVLAAVSVGEAATNGTIKVSPYTVSGSLQYRNDDLYLGASYERRSDCGNPDADAPAGPSCNQAALGSAAQPNGTDSAIRVGAGYTVKRTFTKLAATYEHIDLMAEAEGALARKALQRDVYWGSITQGIFSDTHQVILNYGVATEASGSGVFADTDGTNASTVTVAYRYFLNKNANVDVGFAKVMNGKNAAYRFGSGNFGSVPVGSTSTGYGAGFRYLF
jgi:predicted porin